MFYLFQLLISLRHTHSILNIVVFDVEATCWEGAPPPNETKEIIELGAVRLNRFGEEQSRFSKVIKPVVNPQLSYYCKQLTGIDQRSIHRASPFPRVIEEFQNWAELYDDDYLLVSWGKEDVRLLRSDCALHRVEDYWLEPHINLKRAYKEVKGLPKPIGLRRALEREGFEFDGRHHRGLDDAFNTVKIFVKYLDEWAY